MTEGLDTGTYEVLRDRLVARAGDLAARTEALNARRTEEFGSTRLALDGSARLRTGQPCVPRDLVAVGPHLLFGRDPAAGLPREAGRETGPEDVFGLYDGELEPLPYDAVPGLLDDADFRREFAALHRYYRGARLLRLRRTEGRLLAVFRTGEKPGDVRVLRWVLADDGTSARFLDARGERDHVLPPPHDVTWTDTTRADHVLGRHPHVAVGEGLFVSTVGGALTLKTEDDTETGEGVWSEPVSEPLQSLADAGIAYARAGALTLLRVLPYKEEHARYLAFSRLTGAVVRLDGIGQGCRRLPEDQGVVFPGGYCLADGTAKTFDAVDTDGLEYERTVRAPNGEDVLFAFHAEAAGRGLLLSYNTIREEFAAPLVCRGYALFDDGTLRVLRTEPGTGEPARVHPLQTWTSPYATDTWAAARSAGGGALARIGNADLVRGIADCLTVARTATETTPTAEVYQELLALCARTADSHPWLGDAETGGLLAPLEEVRSTAGQVLAEFETVRELTRQAADALDEAAARIASVVRGLRGQAPRTAVGWVEGLTALRRAHGHLLALKETRYADTGRIDALAADAESELASYGQRAVNHLADAGAFAAYHEDVEELVAEAGALTTAAAAGPVAGRIDELADGLRTVTDVVSALDTGDATVRTAVLEHIAAVLGAVNRARATLEARRRALLAEEGRAEFGAEFALLGQAVAGALAAADTPEACDEELARLLVRVENLESRFAEDDAHLAELDAKRAEIHELLSARKQSLADARSRRAEQRAAAASRVLRTLARRARELPDADAVSAFFASDPMVAKVRRTAEELRELDEPGRAQELDDRLAALGQEAARALRDRDDLYSDGGRTVRLGRHRFAVNTQPLDLTLVPHGDGLALALSGTDYRAPVTDPDFLATRPYWDRAVPSESPAVYRAEHLAARLLAEHGAEALAATDDLAGLVERAARDAYDEGYERGVHDHDAALILAALLRLREGAGPLCHEPAARAAAQLFWAHGTDAGRRTAWARRAASLARARDAFGAHEAVAELKDELAEALAESVSGSMAGSLPEPEEADAGPLSSAAAAYLFDELTLSPEGFVLSAATRTLLDKFRRTADAGAYESDLAALDRLADRRQLAETWLGSYARAAGEPLAPGDLAEAVAAELCPDLPRYALEAPVEERVTGLLGAHPRVEDGALTLRIDEFLARTDGFRAHDVPGFRAYQRQRTALVAAERERLRLEDHRPRALSSFVRGRLVDEVCLPLVGDSLARQMGTADAAGAGGGGTGGLLLLVSPPGYGKTTLMEYVAERLGLVLVKVSGPALGHAVTSFDPAEAPNAMARQEVEKINFALEAGSNTLLYLDDIQHTSPELLQRFIPLCDATRRVEGVWNGRARTYDLRGKRFAVCMAGNPYTGDGSRFRVPDMLANRADVWNLGDVLTGKEHLFALSFVENALTSHPLLAPLADRVRDDLGVLVRLAEQDPSARADQLARPLPAAELDQVLAVLRHLLTARATVLDVNRAYLASAAQSDATRTEPPFRLQGSYRDMNKIARRVQPVMTDAELHALVEDHYAAEAQTLTSGAEANLLKLAELRGALTPGQAARWEEIKRTSVRARALGGDEADPVARAVGALGLLADRVAAVESAITRATDGR
ncbi:DNA repair ATPase [Streptomyces albiaxialis]|uniref:DNA repair ATPase n=1 Tax=Streptomyces albiaxialis TaxID=329523 RepID=A0ABN2W6R7_9ACTN